jgi:hypothetical protein
VDLIVNFETVNESVAGLDGLPAGVRGRFLRILRCRPRTDVQHEENRYGDQRQEERDGAIVARMKVDGEKQGSTGLIKSERGATIVIGH